MLPLQGRPSLLPGDALFLRSDKDLSAEYATVLMVSEGDTCILAPPPTFWYGFQFADLGYRLLVTGCAAA